MYGSEGSTLSSEGCVGVMLAYILKLITAVRMTVKNNSFFILLLFKLVAVNKRKKKKIKQEKTLKNE